LNFVFKYKSPSWTTGVQFTEGTMMEILLLATASRSVLGSTQPHIQWVPGALTLGVKRM